MLTDNANRIESKALSILIDPTIVGKDALLKACYWFSRDFSHELNTLVDGRVQVLLTPKSGSAAEVINSCREGFTNLALDFELRSKIESKTAAIRELILAKAFSESGILEDEPEGKFSDSVEEAKPDGLFHILGSGKLGN